MIDKELMRGAGPVAVLKLLERRPMYGYEIVETLEKQTRGVFVMGESTLYPLLYNLEGKGFVTSRWDDTGPRARKYYRLTPGGKKRLAEDSRRWRSMTEAMGALGIVQEALA
jgi:PadR family transcriptional regulator PadR